MEPQSENLPEKESTSGTAKEAPTQSVRDFLSGTSKLRHATVPVGQIALHRPELACKFISVGNLHHRDTDGKINTTTFRFVRELASKDIPYKRSIKLGEMWEEVDTAWIKQENIGYLMFRNDGGRPFQLIPTPEQLAEARSRVIEVGYMLMDYALPELTKKELTDKVPSKRRRTAWDKPEEKIEESIATPPIIPLWYIIPGESHQGNPSPKHKIYVRCQHGEVTLTILAVAK